MRRKSPKERIAVIGELNVDIVATGLGGPPILGAEVIAESIQTTLGSASAIFACGISRLGHPVTFISKVGSDSFGEFCLKALEKAGVGKDHVMVDKNVRTGITISLSAHKDRALVTYPGAISQLRYEQLPLRAIKNHRHLHMTSYFLQSGLRSSFPEILHKARLMGLSTSFDPNSDPTQAWDKEIWDVIALTDVLFLNETEALQLTGAISARAALKSLGGYTPCSIIKLGSKGAMAIRDGEIARVPGFKIKALDTTGAGDSFDAGFISAYLAEESLEECLRTGNACGALSTVKAGGTESQPDCRALKKFLRQNQ